MNQISTSFIQKIRIISQDILNYLKKYESIFYKTLNQKNKTHGKAYLQKPGYLHETCLYLKI